MNKLTVYAIIWPNTLIHQYSPYFYNEIITPHTPPSVIYPDNVTGSGNPVLENPHVQYVYGGSFFNGAFYNLLDPNTNLPYISYNNEDGIFTQTNYYFPRPFNISPPPPSASYLQTSIYLMDITNNLPLSLAVATGSITENSITCIPSNKLNLDTIPGTNPPVNLNNNEPYFRFLATNGRFEYPCKPESINSPEFHVTLNDFTNNLGTYTFAKWFNIDTLEFINSNVLTIPENTYLNVMGCFNCTPPIKIIKIPPVNESTLVNTIVVLGEGGVMQVIPGDSGNTDYIGSGPLVEVMQTMTK